MSGRTTANLLRIAVVGVSVATLGCVPHLDGPFFDWMLASGRVWVGVSSDNPLPSSSQTDFDPELLGTWAEVAEKPATWTFEAKAFRRYHLEIRADDVVAEFEGTLHRLGPDVFLDLSVSDFEKVVTAESGGGQRRSVQTSFEVHAFFKLKVSESVAQLEGINLSWMREMIETGRIQIDHRPDVEYAILLTAPGSEIAAFLERFAGDPAAFSLASGFELRR